MSWEIALRLYLALCVYTVNKQWTSLCVCAVSIVWACIRAKYVMLDNNSPSVQFLEGGWGALH